MPLAIAHNSARGFAYFYVARNLRKLAHVRVIDSTAARPLANAVALNHGENSMGLFSFRLTHKVAAIGVVGVLGVVLVGGIHLYGETAVVVYRDAAESARAIFELNEKIETELLEGRRAE
jgi:hypothetical protein